MACLAHSRRTSDYDVGLNPRHNCVYTELVELGKALGYIDLFFFKNFTRPTFYTTPIICGKRLSFIVSSAWADIRVRLRPRVLSTVE